MMYYIIYCFGPQGDIAPNINVLQNILAVAGEPAVEG